MTIAATASLRARYTAEQMRSTGVNPTLTVQPLRAGVSALSGSGANIAVFSGHEGTLLVDTGFAVSEREIRQTLSEISPEPVRHVLNTHWHFDHTDGNEWIHASGAVIVAHANTRARLSQHQAIPEFDAVFDPRPAPALPSVVFEKELTVWLNGETIQLRRYAPAHTDSDISVYFERADILHTGDTWFTGMYPFADYNSGGSISGMIDASSKNLRIAGPDTIVLCGHGAIGARKDLVDYHEMLLTVSENIAEMKAKGHSLDRVLAAQPTSSFVNRGSGFISPRPFYFFGVPRCLRDLSGKTISSLVSGTTRESALLFRLPSRRSRTILQSPGIRDRSRIAPARCEAALVWYCEQHCADAGSCGMKGVGGQFLAGAAMLLHDGSERCAVAWSVGAESDEAAARSEIAERMGDVLEAEPTASVFAVELNHRLCDVLSKTVSQRVSHRGDGLPESGAASRPALLRCFGRVTCSRSGHMLGWEVALAQKAATNLAWEAVCEHRASCLLCKGKPQPPETVH